MFPVYKRVKISMPHCPKCGIMLRGNNNTIDPYKCDCGIWEWGWGADTFTIKKDDNNK